MFDVSRQKFSPQTQPISNQFRIHCEMESQSANVAPQITKLSSFRHWSNNINTGWLFVGSEEREIKTHQCITLRKRYGQLFTFPHFSSITKAITLEKLQEIWSGIPSNVTNFN